MAVRFANKSLLTLTFAGAAVAASLSLAAPAYAGDDGEGDIFSTLIGAVVGIKSAPQAPINYRERAPLVVPPTMDLPPPQSSAAVTNPAWPKDPDVVAQQKALARARQNDQALNDENEYSAVLTQSQLAAHEAPAAAPSPTTDPMCNNPLYGCSPAQLWGMLSTRSSKKDDTAGLVPGVDQPRTYLTDPPSGYRVATKAVKLTTAPPPKEDDSTDPGAYYRDQALRSQSIDGSDTQQ